MKGAVDYLGKKFFPSYGGRWAGEFPHLLIQDRSWNRVVQRIHFSPDNFEKAWESVCEICDRLNIEHESNEN